MIKAVPSELAESCLAALRTSAPFGSIPDEIGRLIEKDIIAVFDYDRGPYGRGGACPERRGERRDG